VNEGNPTPALSASRISRTYRRGFGRRVVEALRDVSLSVSRGDFFALIGPNGSGKTTLVNLAAGLLRPTEGSVHIFGHPAGSAKAQAAIGVLPQDVSLPSHLTGREALDLFGGLSGLDRRTRRSRIDRWAGTFGLAGDLDRFVHEYSRGMVQKAGIIQALLHEPDLLLLDEPLSGLDPHAQKTLAEVLTGLAGEGKTVVVSTHLLTNVEEICRTVGILHRGKLLRTGPVAEIRGLRRAFDVRVDATGDLSEEELVRRLGEAGLEIESVRPAVRSLRDVFFEMAGEEPDGEDVEDSRRAGP
jgi:ABC-2 type transport system ATP-binding protein